jgi:hypothetical protein
MKRLAGVLCLTLGVLQPAVAQNTAFTYQGRLNDGGLPANGSFDFQFRLFSAPTNGSQVPVIASSSGVAVSNGLFAASLDFGSNVFNGSPFWLEISVRTNGGGSYSALNPRQAITPSPSALYASSASNLLGQVSAAQLSGTLANGVLPASPTFSGTATAASFVGGGAGLTGLNGSSVTSGTLADARLSVNIPRLNGNQTFTGNNAFASGVTVTGNVRLGAGGTNYAPNGVENLRVVRGIVDLNGKVLVGTGFTVVSNSVGLCTITFNPSFSSYPSVVVSGAANYISTWNNLGPGGFQVQTIDHNGASHNWYFNFIAMGPP